MQQRQIRYRAKGQFNVCFTGDLFWMTEAVGNILKNCVEHTSPGGAVTVSAEGNPLYTELCIEDTGEGIDPEDLPHLFERFYRADDSRGEKSGFGLGLSIAATVAQEHKASLRAESDWDSTRFLFTISLRR